MRTYEKIMYFEVILNGHNRGHFEAYSTKV